MAHKSRKLWWKSKETVSNRETICSNSERMSKVSEPLYVLIRDWFLNDLSSY